MTTDPEPPVRRIAKLEHLLRRLGLLAELTDVTATGGISVGTATGAGAGEVYASGDVRVGGGVSVGSTAVNPGTGEVHLTSFQQQTEIAAPGTPASGFLRWYPDSTQSWGYFINDAGAVVPVGVARLPLPIGAAHGPAFAVLGENHSNLPLPDGSTNWILWEFILPPGWAGRTATFRVMWVPSSTNAGNARLEGSASLKKVGTTLSTTPTVTDTQDVAANGTTDRPQLTTFSLSLSGFAAGDAASFVVKRLGGHANDTFTGIVEVSAAEVSVVG